MDLTDALADGVLETDDPLVHRAWRQSVRPGRLRDEAWVIHADGTWSEAHLEMRPEDVAVQAAAALQARLQIRGNVVYAAAHRWRYARVHTGLDATCLYDASLAVGACGDWGDAGPMRRTRTSVERAWLSGIALAGRVLGS